MQQQWGQMRAAAAPSHKQPQHHQQQPQLLFLHLLAMYGCAYLLQLN
jgi:hypothetical protein